MLPGSDLYSIGRGKVNKTDQWDV